MISRKCTIIEILYYLERQKPSMLVVIGLAITVLIGIFDMISGATFSLALFYLIPIGFFAWFMSLRQSIAIAVLCTIIWASINQFAGVVQLVSSMATDLGFYIIFSLMIHNSRAMYEHEKLLSRTDHLTGLLNNRAFYDVAENFLCIMKRKRLPFAVAFLDLDNFKEINDQYGHDVGDTVLRDFADTLVSTIRVTDKAARFGGDEFVIFFPDTTPESIDIIMDKIRAAVASRMDSFNYQLSFSAGVICCSTVSHTIDELVIMSDKLMYEVKGNGKNSFIYRGVEPAGMPVDQDMICRTQSKGFAYGHDVNA